MKALDYLDMPECVYVNHEEGLTAPTVTVPEIPVIGMDGKTAEGAMPYEILKQQLAFLR